MPDFWYTGKPDDRGIYKDDGVYMGLLETNTLARNICLLLNMEARAAERDEELAAVLRGE